MPLGTPGTGTRPSRAGLSEYAVVLLLAAMGTLVLVETLQVRATSSVDPIGPRAVPLVVVGLLFVVAVLLAVDIARGGRGEEEAGEDVDLSQGTDWRTLLAVVALLVAAGQVIPLIGFPAAGVLLFFGMSRLLGSQHLVRDVLVSVAVPVIAFLLFTQGLGVYLPAGPH